jgi:DNA-binding transcriptional LysR family regulator
MLSTDHLRTFLAVSDGGSFTAAAARLGFTQPAVTQQIHALEDQLGDVRLFRRAGKQMALTRAGEELLAHAREIVGLAERAERHITGLQGHISGRIVLGCAPSTGERLLPALMAACRDLHEAVQFAVEVGPADRLLPWLTDRVVHAIITDEHPRRRSLDVLALGHEKIVCIAARGHALLSGPPPQVAALRDVPLILPQRGTALRRTIEDALRRRTGPGSSLPIVLETDSVTLSAQAAADGLGIAFVPQQRSPKSRDLGIVDVAGLQLEQSWFLARTRGIDEGAALDELWNLVQRPEGRRLLQRLGLKPPVAQSEEVTP